MSEAAEVQSTVSAEMKASPKLADVFTPGAPGTTPNLNRALAIARERCKAIPKDGYNTHHKYAYASAEGVFTEQREAMTGSGLSLLPVDEEVVIRDSLTCPPANWEKDKGAKHDPLAIVPALWLFRVFELLHVSGEFKRINLKWPIVLEAGRTLDKAVAGAKTSSLAYLYRDLLGMSRVHGRDDMNSDERDAADPDQVAADAWEAEKKKPSGRGRSRDAGQHRRPPKGAPHQDQPATGAGPSATPGASPAPTTTVPPQIGPQSGAQGNPAPGPFAMVHGLEPDPRVVAAARRIGAVALDVIRGRPDALVAEDVAAALLNEAKARAAGHRFIDAWTRARVARGAPTVENVRSFVMALGIDLAAVAEAKAATPPTPEAGTGAVVMADDGPPDEDQDERPCPRCGNVACEGECRDDVPR